MLRLYVLTTYLKSDNTFTSTSVKGFDEKPFNASSNASIHFTVYYLKIILHEQAFSYYVDAKTKNKTDSSLTVKDLQFRYESCFLSIGESNLCFWVVMQLKITFGSYFFLNVRFCYYKSKHSFNALFF